MVEEKLSCSLYIPRLLPSAEESIWGSNKYICKHNYNFSRSKQIGRHYSHDHLVELKDLDPELFKKHFVPDESKLSRFPERAQSSNSETSKRSLKITDQHYLLFSIFAKRSHVQRGSCSFN